MLFFDNASIHKTKAVQKLIDRLGMRALTNCPYAPDLNFCERFIKMHKEKIRWHLDRLK
jgi:transposase